MITLELTYSKMLNWLSCREISNILVFDQEIVKMEQKAKTSFK